VETGRVINGRYLLQRLIKQTAYGTVYQGMDQRLQRAVAVKSVLPVHVDDYRAALKVTASFSHPHIIGLNDLIIEPEALYIVQEYVDGESFDKLMQRQLSPFEIAEIGWQMCLALMYAGSSSRRVSHGDLTPAAFLRDRNGVVRLNNIALQTDETYFQTWSMMGAEDVPLLETELPPGQLSEARRSDDTRAVGLLLYQLLTGVAEAPADGRLRFSRATPPELCEIIARTVVRQHPQNIQTPDVLHAQLKALAETLEPPIPAPAYLVAAPVQVEEPLVRQYSPVPAGRGLPNREPDLVGRSVASYSAKLPAMASSPSAPTVANFGSFTNTSSLQSTYPPPSQVSNGSTSPALMILLIGLLAFGLFFAVGYFLGHMLIH
jgi:serine/threonine protein kinase